MKNFILTGQNTPAQLGLVKAEQIDFGVTADYLIDFRSGFRHVLLNLALLTFLGTSISNGATLIVKEVNRALKTKAAYSTTLTGNNNDLVWTAVDGGTGGNDITIRYLNPGTPSAAESVSVSGKAITVNLATGAGTPELETATASGTIRAAVAQVETLTVAETVPGTLSAGNATVTVTCAVMNASPKAIAVALATNDTEAQVASKVRAALSNDSDVAAVFTVSGSSTAVVLTRKASIANDATINIAIADGTCTGLVAVTNSANTTAGVLTGAGNASVIVTATGMTGSPITLSVAVADGDTASLWAAKVRTALGANAAIIALFTVGGSGASITLTKTVAAADIANLNIALADGTCVGINAAASSASSTPGVAPAITSTGDTIKATVLASAAASALVTVADKSGNDGSEAVTALSVQSFTGGVDYTVVQTLVSSVNLADTDPTGTVQALTIAGGAIQGSNALLLSVTAGTATADVKDLVGTFATL